MQPRSRAWLAIPLVAFALVSLTIGLAVVFAILWVIYVNRLVSLEDLGTLWGLLK